MYGKFDPQVREKLVNYVVNDKRLSKYYDKTITDVALVHDVLLEADIVWEGNQDKHRWYNSFNCVVKIGDNYFMFDYADNTGDMGLDEIGWEFDLTSVCEVEPIEKTIVVKEYQKIKEIK